jgi:hypothetical protein
MIVEKIVNEKLKSELVAHENENKEFYLCIGSSEEGEDFDCNFITIDKEDAKWLIKQLNEYTYG